VEERSEPAKQLHNIFLKRAADSEVSDDESVASGREDVCMRNIISLKIQSAYVLAIWESTKMRSFADHDVSK
jgi:hypothetical protein